MIVSKSNYLLWWVPTADQLDHPDHRNFTTKPDQARLKMVYTTSSRPFVDNARPPHDSFTTSTQPSFRFPLDHFDLYASPIRSQLDQVDLSSDRHQIFTRPWWSYYSRTKSRTVVYWNLRIKTSDIVVHLSL